MYKFDESMVYTYNMRRMSEELGIDLSYFIQLRTQCRVGLKFYNTTYGWMFTKFDIDLFKEVLKFPRNMKSLDKQERVIIMKYKNSLEVEKMKAHYEKYGNLDYDKEEVEETEQLQVIIAEPVEEINIDQIPIETKENKFYRALQLLERISSDKEMYLATLEFLHKNI